MLKRIYQITLMLGIVVTANLAVAQIDNAPGSMCVATTGAATVNTAGNAYNNTNNWMTMICPADRQTTDGTFSKKFRGSVWVVDRHPTLNVCCRAKSRNPGGATKQSAAVCSNGAQTGYQIINLPEISDPYTWSHFYFQCTVPAKHNGAASSVLTFRAIQNP